MTAKDVDSISSASDNSGTLVKKHTQEEQLKQSATQTPKMMEKKENKSNTNTIKVFKWLRNMRFQNQRLGSHMKIFHPVLTEISNKA